jgi:hypothetical protein
MATGVCGTVDGVTRCRHPEVRVAFDAPRRMVFSVVLAAILRGAHRTAQVRCRERAHLTGESNCVHPGDDIGAKVLPGRPPDGQISQVCVQPLLQKYFCFLRGQITCLFLAIPSRERGRWPSSRTLGWDAVDAAASGAWRDRRAGSPVSDRTARRRPALKRLGQNSSGSIRSAESFGEGSCVRQNRVVLAPVAGVKLAEICEARPGLR